jgi:hypothetical protein
MVRSTLNRTVLAILLIASTLVVGVMPAAAGDKKVGGSCTESFVEIPTSTYPNFGPGIDKNGDGTLCEKPLPGVGNEGFFNVVDNMAAPRGE